MQSVNISSAKGYLSSLLKNKEKLQEIIIERTGKPIAKILKYETMKNCNRLSLLKNKII